ncbi:CDP-alcohol phosphatidyltransferase [Novosphingobium nitrogenifigens DSM 19370]|uniref:CDP-alcohol phosphatidyltransferase n=1 Tax=Novosphingobium nitrogenifigens DSM 19370 TaxID=983920 RepID=F1ZC90_9SPHN|nr:phosphatidylcholine/phosphatidylserine synthase [Novosphingobium nitrogenifigens]EGD57703.1 CDP-alcohol phosphatidyltransferase [Novosphingobium nitrogenifigens DSM 19370]
MTGNRPADVPDEDDADALFEAPAHDAGYDFGRKRLPRGLTLRALVPNAVTSAALCCGLTGIRFAIGGDFHLAVQAVIVAGMLDGIDGRIARAMRAQSRFGAELDSLSDAISFGVAPALVLYLWSLQVMPRFGWFAALALAVCCALRLARFNAQIDMAEPPQKRAGFLTGVPAPVGAGLALMPIYLWIASGRDEFRNPPAVALWTVMVAFLMISNTATLGWGALRPRRSVRLELIGLFGLVFAALLTEPWLTLVGICAVYLALLPVGMIRYSRVKRQREAVRGKPVGDA